MLPLFLEIIQKLIYVCISICAIFGTREMGFICRYLDLLITYLIASSKHCYNNTNNNMSISFLSLGTFLIPSRRLVVLIQYVYYICIYVYIILYICIICISSLSLDRRNEAKTYISNNIQLFITIDQRSFKHQFYFFIKLLKCRCIINQTEIFQQHSSINLFQSSNDD